MCNCHDGTAEGFLRVNVKWSSAPSGPQITLLQVGLAKHIIEAFRLFSSFSTAIGTPAKSSPLPKDVDDKPAFGSFNYTAVIGMLFYPSSHSSPDFAFTIHECACYTFHPSHCHELALIHIGHYLKDTVDKGIIKMPSSIPQVDCYPDAEFSDLYLHEDS
jgi:hypothetical protein